MAQEVVNRFVEFSTSRSRIQTHIGPKEMQPNGSLCKMFSYFYLQDFHFWPMQHQPLLPHLEKGTEGWRSQVLELPSAQKRDKHIRGQHELPWPVLMFTWYVQRGHQLPGMLPRPPPQQQQAHSQREDTQIPPYQLFAAHAHSLISLAG